VQIGFEKIDWAVSDDTSTWDNLSRSGSQSGLMSDIDVKGVGPNEAPPALMPWSSRLLVGGGLAASLVAHIAVGGVVLFASPKLFATVPEQTIAIDIVSPEEFEQASKGQTTGGPDGVTLDAKAETKDANAESKSDPKADATSENKPATDAVQRSVQQPKAPAPARKPDVPPPLASAQTQLQPPSQIQQPRAQPPQPQPPQLRPSSLPTPLPPSPSVLSANAPSADTVRSAAAAPAPNQPMPEQTTVPPDAAAMVDLLHLPVEMADASPGGPPSETAAKLGSEEIAAFKGYLKQCWVPPSGIPQTSNKFEAVVRVSLGPNGRLVAQPVLVAVHGAASVFGPTLVDSFKKGLVRCQPYAMLPADKYSEWKTLDLNFSQDGVSDVNPVAAGAKEGPNG
jgi:hypothetical protein